MKKNRYIDVKNKMSGKKFEEKLSACLDRQYSMSVGLYTDDIVIDSDYYWDERWEDLFVVMDIRIEGDAVKLDIVNYDTGEIHESIPAEEYESVHESEVLIKYF